MIGPSPRPRLVASLAAACLLLSACGGGGGGSSVPGPTAGSLPSGLDSLPAERTCVAPPRPGSRAAIALVPVYEALRIPGIVDLVQAPDDPDTWYLVVQDGRIYAFDVTGDASDAELVADLRARVQGPDVQPSLGVLSIAFHPDVARNDELYVYATERSRDAESGTRAVLLRYTWRRDRGRLDPRSDETVLAVDLPTRVHHGGAIAFGPDGFLYWGLGDGGPSDPPQGRGQDLDTLLGKMLRIDVDRGRTYGIPADNPFAGGGGRPEIYAWGLRNPWRWSFDRETGELWLGDVGWVRREEVDRIRLGRNYGWNEIEGTLCVTEGCDPGLYEPPVLDLPRAQARSITGGRVYRGAAIPALAGTYVFGDFVVGALYGVTEDAGTARLETLLEPGLSIVSFGEDADGELYVLDYASGGISRIVESDDPASGVVPALLSRSGCADPEDPREATPSQVPYAVNAPLWSDGAAKLRWASVPAGERITVADDGDWLFPVGTVLRKDFRLAGRLVETRLLVRHDAGEGRTDEGWAGYSYEWDADERDARLLAAGKTVGLGSGASWTFPSRGDCLRCHTRAAGRTLGPTTAQLNRELTYSATGRTAEQLATFDHLGLLEPSPPLPSTLPAQARPSDEAAALEDRARAYLDSNCSHCHRPGGPGLGPADYRLATPFAEMGICETVPFESFGVEDARLLVPGDRERSLVYLRLTDAVPTRMPPLATAVVDAEGAELIGSWIDSLSRCR